MIARTFDVVIILGAICGVLMVVGGMVLLAIGAIKLEAVAPAVAGTKGEQRADALILEFKKTIKVTAHYPALALFLIGVLFIFGSLWFSKSEGKIQPWSILGKIDSPDPSAVTVEIEVDKLKTLSPTDDGYIDTVIHPDLDQFKAIILAPGCKPERQYLSLKVKDAKKHILELTAAKVHKIADKPAGTQIAQLPANVQLPPVTSSEAFNK
jgi:hypothetical protein